jgi:hypothetical protein
MKVPHGIVSAVLIQQGKSKVKHLKEDESINTESREYKELIFLSEITKQEDYEKSKEVKWFVCKGIPEISSDEKTGSLF